MYPKVNSGYLCFSYPCVNLFQFFKSWEKPTTHAASSLAPPVPYDSYYGLYIKGQKVGYMRTQLQLQPQPQLIAELHAQVAGMGQVAEIDMRETRQYAAAASAWTGQLKKIFFTQRAATGSVTVKGWRRADGKAVQR